MTFNHGVWSSILQWVTKKKRQFSTEDCRFFVLFTISVHSSLFFQIVVSGEKIREKSEEKQLLHSATSIGANINEKDIFQILPFDVKFTYIYII